MSMASRELKVGDWAITDYNSCPSQYDTLVRVQIVAEDRIRANGLSHSGVLFQVKPLLKHGTPESWYCADWFSPLRADRQLERPI